MPKLLLISPFFPPSAASGSFRMLGFARHLPKYNWSVSVVACGPLPWESEDQELLGSVPPQTQVQYVEFPLQRAHSFWPLVLQKLRVVRGMYYWNRPALRACRKAIEQERPDAVMTSGPPHSVHLIGQKLQRQYGLPWVADFRDPWCSWGQEQHYGRKWGGLGKIGERKVFQRADVLIANTPIMADVFREVFPSSAGRIVAIPNGYDPVEIEELPAKDRENNFLTLLYAGVIYVGRDPRPVVEALRMISEEQTLNGKQLVLRLIGKCHDAQLQHDFQSRGLSRWVKMEDQVSHREATQAARSADLLVLLDSPGRRIGVPAKLYEYLGARRPILALAEQGSDTDLMQQSGLPYRVVHDWNAKALRDAIVGLSREAPSIASEPAGEQPGLFTREAAAKKLAHVLTSKICGGSRAV